MWLSEGKEAIAVHLATRICAITSHLVSVHLFGIRLFKLSWSVVEANAALPAVTVRIISLCRGSMLEQTKAAYIESQSTGVYHIRLTIHEHHNPSIRSLKVIGFLTAFENPS